MAVMTGGSERVGRPGPLWRILTAWGDLRGSMRTLLAGEPREGTLLAMALGSSAIWALGRLMQLWFSPAAAELGPEPLVGRAGDEIVAALFYRPLMLYAVAGFAGLVARVCGSRASWRESRAATFWAALVAAPVALLAALAGALLPDAGAMVAESLGSLAFALAFAVFFAEAHGFRVIPVLAALFALSAGFFMLLLAIG